MVEQSEDLNQKNLIRKIAGSYHHNPNPQECVGKVKTMKIDLRF